MASIKDYDILLREKTDSELRNYFPITKTDNVMVSTDKTLTTYLKELELTHYKYDLGLEKLDNIEDLAEVNQNAYSKVKFGFKSVSAKNKTDTLSLAAGENISIDSDENDSIVISSTYHEVPMADEFQAGKMSRADYIKLQGIESYANNYIHPKSGVVAGLYSYIRVDDKGHIIEGMNEPVPVELGGTGVKSYTELGEKLNLDALVKVDNTVTATGKNPVSGSAVYDALLSKAEKNHGLHVPDTSITTSDGITFLANNNTWQSVRTASITQSGVIRLTSNYDDVIDGRVLTPEAVRQGDAEVKSYVDKKFSDLIGGAPETLDTIYELASAAEQHTDLLTRVDEAIGKKVDKVDGKGLSTNDYTTEDKNIVNRANTHMSNTSNPHNVTKTQIGLSDVTNDKQVKGLSSGTSEDNVVVFGADGYSIKDSGHTIKSNVPENAKFTDTVYTMSVATDTNKYPFVKLIDSNGREVGFSIYGDDRLSVSKDAYGNIKIDASGIKYNEASESGSGFMSKSDYIKLKGIEEGANKYVHPTSGVVVGTYLKVSVDKYGHVISGSNEVIAVSEGGTGANNAKDALVNLGIKATATEINYLSGVTANIQDQLSYKVSTDTFSKHTHPQYSTTDHTHSYYSVTTHTHTLLSNLYSSRPASANISATGSGGISTFKATSSMTTGKPATDGHIIHFYWDNNGGSDSQLCIPTVASSSNRSMQYRGMDGSGTWGEWKTILDSSNYGSYALPLSGGTLTGPLNIRGTADSQPLKVRGIVGSTGADTVEELYLQFGANNKIRLGNTGAHSISADGSEYTGNAATATKATSATYSTSAGYSSTAAYANYLAGFVNRDRSITWGTLSGSDYTYITRFETANGGSIAFADKSGQTSFQVDGFIYQNEGNYLCLDTNNYKTYCTPANIGAATSSHTHSIYSPTNHSHSQYSVTSHTHSIYSPTNHSHSQYSLTSHTHSYLPLSGGTMSGDLNFSHSSGAITWNGDDYRQRIQTVDDSTSDTAVFSFQQSSNAGSSYTDLMVIRNNGKVIANTFVGSLSGKATSATYSTSAGYSSTAAYAPSYSLTSHSHSQYSVTSHTHSIYSPTNHSHSQYSLTNHTHSFTDVKVTQTAVGSDYTSWRPLVIGSSNSSTEGFSPSTVTDGTYTSVNISCQPSSGTIRATTFKGSLSGKATSATYSTSAAYATKASTADYASIANTSYNSNWLNTNTTLKYGASGLQYFNQSTSTTSGASVNANPTNDWYHIIRMNHANSNGYYVDLAACFHSDRLYYRRVASGTEVTWTRILDSTCYSDYALPLTGGTLSGAITSNSIITFGKNDEYGIRTSTNNYCRIGESSYRFYESYINNMYGARVALTANAVATPTTYNGYLQCKSLTDNRICYLPDASGTIALTSQFSNYSTTAHTHSYLPLSGGTMTGGLTISASWSNGLQINADSGNGIHIYGDNEGGNIRIYSDAGADRYWEIDALGGTLRFYTTPVSTWSYTSPLYMTSDGIVVSKINGFKINSVGAATGVFNGIPVIASDGVMEVGRFIDFHYDNTTSTDNTLRIQTASDGTFCSSGSIKSDYHIYATGSFIIGNGNCIYPDAGSTTYGLKFTYFSNPILQIIPNNDAKTYLGHASYRFAEVRSVNMYISAGTAVTSDRRYKNTINELDEELSNNFIMSLKPSSFKYNDGESGRLHYGLIAQDVEDAMKANNISSQDFAGLIIEKLTEPIERDVLDNDGNIVINEETGEPQKESYLKETGEIKYDLRYEEFIAPMIKVIQKQNREIEDLRDEISKLKELITQS